jgi:hypothetical protein
MVLESCDNVVSTSPCQTKVSPIGSRFFIPKRCASYIAFISAGHHATERYGIQALCQHLSDKFNIKHQFIDVDNHAIRFNGLS